MNLKKLALGMIIAGALTTGYAAAGNFAKIHPEVRLEQKIEQQLDKRNYVKCRNNAEIIEYNKNHTNIQYYSFADGKIVDDVLHQDEMIYDGIKLEYHWDAVKKVLDEMESKGTPKENKDGLLWAYKNFTKQTITAIELIRKYDSGVYQDLKSNVKLIKFMKDYTCALGADEIHVGLGENFDIIDLYIGTIAHEITHLKQYQRPCDQQKTYDEMEEEAVTKQLETQKLMKKNGCVEITDYEINRSEIDLKNKTWRDSYRIRFGTEKGNEILKSKPLCR